ncbi:hypothetical protein AB0M02_22470 [Actinoplanes sp. NPDC051861]|uniref:hypothetical protein n=1 Tax=Actinoplanes sp. NPDC051861 TaxID=3155170 RepID=UPI0034348A06
MTIKVIKVDRVGSADEATTLEALGAGVIGVDVDVDPRFADDRTLDAGHVARIRQEIRRAKIAVAMNLHADPAHVVERARLTGADLVQPITSAIPPHPVRLALRDAGIGIVYAGIEISHDDDPGWVFGTYDDTPDLNASLFQVEVLPEYRDSWAFLRDRSPEFEDEFQIDDLVDLARDRPITVGLDLTTQNLGEVAAALVTVQGFTVTLAERATRADARHRSYVEIVDILKAA